MKKFFRALWRMIRGNIVLKIVAVLFAVVLWSYVLGETNPVRTTYVNNVPVKWDNVASLKDKNLAISGNLQDILNTVNVRIQVNQNQYKLVNQQSVHASIDLSTLNGTGEQPLKVNWTTDYGSKLEITPSEVSVYVDKYKEKDVPVKVETAGSVPSDFYADTPVVSPDVIRIGGAMADVSKVVSAICTVNLNGLTDGFSRSYDVKLLDETGAEVDPKLFSNVPSVIINESVQPVKTVPVDVQGSLIGQDSLAPGYEIISVKCDPESVRIVGDKAALDAVSSIQLTIPSIAGFSADAVLPVEYKLPAGVKVLDSASAQVTVNIREISSQQTYKNVTVKLKNVPVGMTAAVDPASVNVTVTAGVPRMSKLLRSQVVPYVDLDGLGPGVYSLPVKFELPDGFVAENFAPGSATVNVTINAK